MAPVFMIFLFHAWILLISLPATLSMQFAPEIPENITSFEGETVILRCVVVDKDEDNPVFWQRYDGSSKRLGTISRDRDTESYAHFYPDFSPRLEVVGDESLGDYHLLISNLSLQDEGRYVCFFRNDRGYGTYAPITYLRVLPRGLVGIANSPGLSNPVCQATVSTPSQPVSVGTTVELVCRADAIPDISSLVWYVGPGNTQASTQEGLCDFSKTRQQRICTFRRTLALHDIGVTFRCIARVGPSEQGSRQGYNTPSCSITPLRNSTTVLVYPTPNRVGAGETATFFCVSAANARGLRYNWFLNEGPLQSTTARLMVSSTGDYLYENTITCVVSNHFSYLGHGTAVLVFDPPRGQATPPIFRRSTTSSTSETEHAITTRTLTESISELIHYVNNGVDSITVGSVSIDNLKPPTNTGDHQVTIFPIVMTVAIALGAILIAVLLALVTACVIKRKKRGDANLDDKVIQLQTISPLSGKHPSDNYNKANISSVNSKKPKAPSVVKKTPDSTLFNNNKAPIAYAVLDPNQVDNDSLSSLELQDIINSSEESSHGQPTTRGKTRPRVHDIPVQHKASFSSGKPNISRGRSASTPGGPVIVYAGERKQENCAVAYAVTNIIGNRKCPAIVENNDSPAPSMFYDNNMLTSTAKGLSRKRAMSSPMTGRLLTTERDTTTQTTEYPNTNNRDTSSEYNSRRTGPHIDDTSPYAEISELITEDTRETVQTEPSGGAISTVPEPPFPYSYLRSDNAYAVTKVVSLR